MIPLGHDPWFLTNEKGQRIYRPNLFSKRCYVFEPHETQLLQDIKKKTFKVRLIPFLLWLGTVIYFVPILNFIKDFLPPDPFTRVSAVIIIFLLLLVSCYYLAGKLSEYTLKKVLKSYPHAKVEVTDYKDILLI